MTYKNINWKLSCHNVLHIYIIRSSNINVKTCGCDSLYCAITNFYFCCFRAMAYIRLLNWVQFCLF